MCSALTHMLLGLSSDPLRHAWPSCFKHGAWILLQWTLPHLMSFVTMCLLGYSPAADRFPHWGLLDPTVNRIALLKPLQPSHRWEGNCSFSMKHLDSPQGQDLLSVGIRHPLSDRLQLCDLPLTIKPVVSCQNYFVFVHPTPGRCMPWVWIVFSLRQNHFIGCSMALCLCCLTYLRMLARGLSQCDAYGPLRLRRYFNVICLWYSALFFPAVYWTELGSLSAGAL